MNAPRLICLLGAESTGKTTLAQALAKHFDCPWVPEYLRQFCAEHGRTPLQHEQQQIISQQLADEDAALAIARARGAPCVFCDTAPLQTAAYSEAVFADRSLYPEALLLHPRYALTLLLDNDVAWQADEGIRDGEHVRAPILRRLQHMLAQQTGPVVFIQGTGEARLEAALQAIEQHLPTE